MAATPETKAKNRIKKLAKAIMDERGLPSTLVWNAGAGYGVSTVDCTGVIAGHPVAIEVKRFDGKGKLTGRQKQTLREYRDAGAYILVIEDDASLRQFLLWLMTLEPRTSFVDYMGVDI